LRRRVDKSYTFPISIAELKAEVDRLSPEERHQLRAYLALKDQISEADFLNDLSAKISDRNPDRWLTIDEFERRVEA
jgi:hypothetical protein